jgi:hypothetical protein
LRGPRLQAISYGLSGTTKPVGSSSLPGFDEGERGGWDEGTCDPRTATITEWQPKEFLKLSADDRPLRCMVLFWLFFVLVLVLVLVLDSI